MFAAGAGDDGGAASSRSRFLAERVRGTGMEAAVEEFGQHLLENPDAGINGRQCLGENRARAARGMIAEEAPASCVLPAPRLLDTRLLDTAAPPTIKSPLSAWYLLQPLPAILH